VLIAWCSAILARMTTGPLVASRIRIIFQLEYLQKRTERMSYLWLNALHLILGASGPRVLAL